jgi:hypothetical protein
MNFPAFFDDKKEEQIAAAVARSSDDRAGAGLYPTSSPGSYHSNTAVQSGLRVLQ